MGYSSVDSFEDCIQDCDSTTGCIDVSFVWPNACYKKNTLNAEVSNEAVWTARRISDGTEAEVVKPLSCENLAADGKTYVSKKGTFLIECGVDYG